MVVSRRLLAFARFHKSVEELAIVVLESPRGGGTAGGERACMAARVVQHLREAPGQVCVIVRIVDDETFADRLQGLAGQVGNLSPQVVDTFARRLQKLAGS